MKKNRMRSVCVSGNNVLQFPAATRFYRVVHFILAEARIRRG